MTINGVRLYPVELRVPDKVLDGLDQLAHRAGISRAAMAQRLFDAAYAARFADVGDPVLEIAVRRAAPPVSSAPVATPAVLATPPAPVETVRGMGSGAPAPADRPEALQPPPAPTSEAGFPETAPSAVPAVAAAAEPPPVARPPQGGAPLTPAQQRSVKALYAMGAKPFDIATQLKVPLADVRAFLASRRQ